jgi:signal transduction histidine kinase
MEQKLLQSAMDSSPAMIQVFEAVRDSKGTIIDFKWILNNPASEKMYGDVLGKSLLSLNPGAIEEGIFDTFKQVTETGVPDASEKHYVRDHFKGWFYQSVVKLNDGVATSTIDITHIKTTELKARSGLEFFQSVVDSSLDVIQVFEAVRNEKGNIIDFVWILNNTQGVKQNGDVVGKRLTTLSPGVIVSGIFDKMVNVTETGISYKHEHHYPYEHFGDAWFYQALVKHEDGLIMTTRDITTEKRAEQELLNIKDELAKKAADKYVWLFNSIEQGFCTIQIIFNEAGEPIDYRFLEMNKAFEAQTGLKNAVGKTVRNMLPEHENYWYEIYGAVAKTGLSKHFEEYASALGRWYDVYAFRIDAPEDHHVAVLFNDITERKKAAENLLQAQESEKAQKHRRELLKATLNAQEKERRRIAENLHNGLGQILFGALLNFNQLNLKKGDTWTAHHDEIRQMTMSLLQQAIRESRDISHELMPNVLQDFGFKAAIEDICKQFKGVLDIRCLFHNLPEVMEQYIEIVIYRSVQELLVNTIKHASANKVSVSINYDAKQYTVEVSDNGKGFDASKTSYGIGLHTIRQHIELLRGVLDISPANPGTRVQLTIPS